MSDILTEKLNAAEKMANALEEPGAEWRGKELNEALQDYRSTETTPPPAPPEPTEAQCWEQLGRWGQAERELLGELQRVRGEYQAWLGKLRKLRHLNDAAQ